MSVSKELFKTTPDDKKENAVTKLIAHSFPTIDFYLMVILSVAMASFGLIINSAAVIIGSMLIAPVLYPVLSVAMGFIIFNDSLTFKSIKTLVRSVVYALGTSFVVGLLFANREEVRQTAEIISRTNLDMIHILVAIVAGLASAFALVKPKLSETIPGIAISVSLVPPLAAAGVGLSVFDFAIFKGAFALFVVNVLGVIIASSLVFSLMNFYSVRRGAGKALTQEEQEARVRKDALQRAEEIEEQQTFEEKLKAENSTASADTTTQQ